MKIMWIFWLFFSSKVICSLGVSFLRTLEYRKTKRTKLCGFIFRKYLQKQFRIITTKTNLLWQQYCFIAMIFIVVIGKPLPKKEERVYFNGYQKTTITKRLIVAFENPLQ